MTDEKSRFSDLLGASPVYITGLGDKMASAPETRRFKPEIDPLPRHSTAAPVF